MTTTATDPSATDRGPGERADLLASLAAHRGLLLRTLRDLTDEQAAQRTTVNALRLGGLVKHVAATEAQWLDFAQRGAEAMAGGGDEADYAAGFSLQPGETLAGVLRDYGQVAARTDALVADGLDLDAAHALPVAPWFEPGARWSVRRVLLHLIAETAQHAGHADILRESLDGAKTMG